MIWFANEEKVKSLISDLPKYSVIVADEAIKLLFKQNWQSKLSKFMNLLFTVSRDENKIVFLLMPRFVDFNEYFRNHRIFLWIHVVERGVAVVFKKEWSPFAVDPWNVSYNSKLITELPKRKETMNLNDKIKILARCKGFLCWFRYPDLDKETKKYYRKLKNRNKYITEHEEEMTNVKKDKMMLYIRIARLVNKLALQEEKKPTQICQDVADISPETYRKYEKMRHDFENKEAVIVDKNNQKYWEELKAKRIAEREKEEDGLDDDMEKVEDDNKKIEDTPKKD